MSIQQDTVHFQRYQGGPLGLGDPNDLTLRKVELEVMIPKKMRHIAKTEMCPTEVQKFSECCKSNSLLMVVNCQTENKALKACLTKWYENDAFRKRCTEEYLQERTEYRRTGINPNKKSERIPNSM